MNYMQPPMFLLYSYHTHLYNMTSNMKYTGIHCTSLVREGSSNQSWNTCHSATKESLSPEMTSFLMASFCDSSASVLLLKSIIKLPVPGHYRVFGKYNQIGRVATIRVTLFSFFNLDHFYLVFTLMSPVAEWGLKYAACIRNKVREITVMLARRDLWRPLGQSPAPSKANVDVTSGCSGPGPAELWKSPKMGDSKATLSPYSSVQQYARCGLTSAK